MPIVMNIDGIQLPFPGDAERIPMLDDTIQGDGVSFVSIDRDTWNQFQYLERTVNDFYPPCYEFYFAATKSGLFLRFRDSSWPHQDGAPISLAWSDELEGL